MSAKIRLAKIISALALSVSLMCATMALADGLEAIDDGSLYACKHYDIGITNLILIGEGTLSEVNPTSHLRMAIAKRKQLQGKQRSTFRPGRANKIAQWKRIIAGIRSCINSNTNYLACSVFGGNGSRLFNFTPYIIGGSTCSPIGSAVVEIFMYDEFNESLGSCTGTVIDGHTVLSAAHCFANDDGTIDVASVEVQTGTQIIDSQTFYVHPLYDPYSEQSESHDFSIIKLPEEADATPFPMHFTADLQYDEILAISGYGLDSEGNSDVLKGGFMKVYTAEPSRIQARYLPGSGSNTCNGDSGGPVAVYRSGIWKLVGATSNGDNGSCGVNGNSDLSRWGAIADSNNRSFIEDHLEPS